MPTSFYGYGVSLALALSVGCIAAEAQPTPMPDTRLVTVDGRAVRVKTAGLEARAPGTPVVVFEAGATNSLDVWSAVLPRVARFAPVIAYDRAGLGQSEWDGEEPTPPNVVARLRRLLVALDAPPPYLLVGFSWGAILSGYHAGSHPEDVAGLVLVDPAPLVTHPLERRLAAFHRIGAGRAGFDSLWAAFARLHRSARDPLRAEFEVYSRLAAAPVPDSALRPLPEVPTVVIVAGKHLSLPLELPYDARAHFEAELDIRIDLLGDWIGGPGRGTVVVANHVTHLVPREDPQLIASAIRHALSAPATASRREGRRVETGVTPRGLYYEIAGAGEPVVFIHAFSLDSRMWDPQFTVLADQFRVVRYDLRAHGRSAAPDAPYTGYDDLRELLDHLGIDRALLVGSSAGAELAVNFAIVHPDRAAGLVLAAPGVGGFQAPPMPWLRPVFQAAADGDIHGAAALWAETPIMALHVDTAARWAITEIVGDNAALWGMRRLEQPLAPPAIQRLAEVKAPATIIVGERDLPHIHEIAELLSAGIANATLVTIPGVGHIANLDDPVAFNAALARALGR